MTVAARLRFRNYAGDADIPAFVRVTNAAAAADRIEADRELPRPLFEALLSGMSGSGASGSKFEAS